MANILTRPATYEDLAGWRRERVPDSLRGAAWEVAPDWVCEVLSPSTARFDRVVKLPTYAQYGIARAWVVDPVLQTREVFRLVEGQWTLTSTHPHSPNASTRAFVSSRNAMT